MRARLERRTEVRLLQADIKGVELDFLEEVWERVGPLDGGGGATAGC